MKRDGIMNYLSLIGIMIVLFGSTACSLKSKPKPLVPLALESGVKPQVVTLTEQGTLAYHATSRGRRRWSVRSPPPLRCR